MVFEKPLLRSLNHVLGQNAWATDKLKPYAGRHARLAMPPLLLDCIVAEDGRLAELVETDAGDKPDVEIALPLTAPLLALQGSDRLMGDVQITGSAEFADAFGFVLRNLRWDIEEDLSKAVGDIAAHRIVGALEALAAWQKQAAVSLAENVTDYFTEERRALMKPEDISAFTSEVDCLRDDVARLEKRLTSLG